MQPECSVITIVLHDCSISMQGKWGFAAVRQRDIAQRHEVGVVVVLLSSPEGTSKTHELNVGVFPTWRKYCTNMPK